MHLKDYILHLPAHLNQDLCTALVNFFEHHKASHIRVDQQGHPSFTHLYLNRIPEAQSLLNQLMERVQQGYKSYIQKHPRSFSFLPKDFFLEEFRIKRYNSNGHDRFDTHVDVSNYHFARRYMAFLFYLNTVDKGGETTFCFEKQLSFQPEIGAALIFPPTWQYPHFGAPPRSNTKYIFSTYLHYPNQ